MAYKNVWKVWILLCNVKILEYQGENSTRIFNKIILELQGETEMYR